MNVSGNTGSGKPAVLVRIQETLLSVIVLLPAIGAAALIIGGFAEGHWAKTRFMNALVPHAVTFSPVLILYLPAVLSVINKRRRPEWIRAFETVLLISLLPILGIAAFVALCNWMVAIEFWLYGSPPGFP